MNLNDLMKKAIKNKNDNKNNEVNIKKAQIFLLLGTRIILIYLMFIFLVGKYIAQLLGYNNLYFLSVLIATLFNIYVIVEAIKQFKNKN